MIKTTIPFNLNADQVSKLLTVNAEFRAQVVQILFASTTTTVESVVEDIARKHGGQKISAIKELRAYAGATAENRALFGIEGDYLGLAEAKQLIEKAWAKLGIRSGYTY